MSSPLSEGPAEDGSTRGATKKMIAGVLVCLLALALGVGYFVSSRAGSDASAGSGPKPAGSVLSASASPTAEAEPAAPVEPAEATQPAESTQPGELNQPAESTSAESSTKAATEPEPTAAAEPGEEGTDPAEEAAVEAQKPAASDAALAAIAQPESAPVNLEEPSVVVEGVTASISGMEAIEAEALGIGEIAGPALRFVITVDNSTGEDVSLANSVVNVEFGPENLPAVQLTGSGATAFPATVAAGESVSTTLVFSVPADQREKVRILLNLEASSPIAAFVGAAPDKEG